MRVLIICSSLEPGKDGVGDYSLKFGNWLKDQGYEVEIIALNDKYLAEKEKRDETIFRLSSGLKLNLRFELLQERIDEFNPDVIFLQYVPYAYHAKGMPLKFAKMIGNLNTKGEWIIMVHEPYIGGRLTAKGKFVQFAQKKALKRIVKKTAPKRVFTSIRKYEEALTDINITSSILPLFGNIEFTQLEEAPKKDSDETWGVYFGAPPVKESYHIIKNGIVQAGSSKPIRIKLCGKTSNTEFIEYLRYSFREENIEVDSVGELQQKELSSMFTRADFGIARVAPDLIGKSGSAISLLEHGLKLWIPLANSQHQIEKESVFRPELCFADLGDLLSDDSQPERISNLEKVGKLLLLQLNEDI